MRRSFLVAVLALSGLAGAHAQTEAPGEVEQSVESNSKWSLQLSGFSRHFGDPKNKNRRYNEQNWGIGAQYTTSLHGVGGSWISKSSFGTLKDSMNEHGLYAGTSLQKRLFGDSPIAVDVGAGAFLFYRTMKFDGPHKLVAAPMPVLSFTHQASGIGANVLATPRIKTDRYNMPGFVFVQLTYRF